MANDGIFISSDYSPARLAPSLVKGTDIYGETERKNFSFLEGCGYKKRKGLTVFVKRSKK